MNWNRCELRRGLQSGHWHWAHWSYKWKRRREIPKDYAVLIVDARLELAAPNDCLMLADVDIEI